MLLSRKAVSVRASAEASTLAFDDARMENGWVNPINNRNGFSWFSFNKIADEPFVAVKLSKIGSVFRKSPFGGISDLLFANF